MAALGLGLTAQRPTMNPNAPTLQSLLFAAGQPGALYEPSVTASLYQDAAGTVPWTTIGDPVGRLSDRSGNGHHATQATAGARPVGGSGVLFCDGVDDYLTADAAVANVATGDDFFLISAFTTEPSATEQVLFSVHDAANQNKLVIAIAADGTLLLAAGDGADTFFGTGLDDRAAHVITLAIAGATGDVTLWIDGALVYSGVGNSVVPWSEASKASIGMEWDATVPSDYFFGPIYAMTCGFYRPPDATLLEADALVRALVAP